jgi:drug/metabolite transporter (DMT)-like permease
MKDDPGTDGLNLSSEQPTQQDLRPQEHQTPYDPARDREIARARIAGGLLLGFFVAVLGYLVAATIAGASFQDLSAFFDKLFTALVGLVGTALGFYFGYRER